MIDLHDFAIGGLSMAGTILAFLAICLAFKVGSWSHAWPRERIIYALVLGWCCTALVVIAGILPAIIP